MTSAVDQKTFWGLGEMVMWITCSPATRVSLQLQELG
jgi:hypothetical protein